MTSDATRIRRNRAYATNALLLVLGMLLLALCKQLTLEFHHFSIGFSGVARWSVIIFLIATLVALTQPTNGGTLTIILGFGLAFRLVVLLPEPFMSSDIYRYVWDGVVQHAHISPYRYVPGDPALAFLRHENRDVFDHINRRDYAHTIYPPLAQIIFYGASWFNPSVTFMKVVMLLFEAVTVYALIQLLRELGMGSARVLIYAWCPLLIWEIGSSGHLDGAVMAFVSLALLARQRREPLMTGLALGAAIMIKLYPVALLPALWRRGDRRMPLAVLGVIAAGYALYSSVGLKVAGFLPGYAQEEGMQSGSRYFALALIRKIPGLEHTPTSIFLVFAAMVMGSLTWILLRVGHRDEAPVRTLLPKVCSLPSRSNFLMDALLLAWVMMLLFSPHYPWYVAWLIPFSAVLPRLPVLAYTLGLFYLCTSPLGSGTEQAQFSLNCILYSTVAIIIVIEMAARCGYDRLKIAGRQLL